MNRQKRFREIFGYREDIREKRVSAKLTTITPCQRGQRLRGHGQDYADTFGKF